MNETKPISKAEPPAWPVVHGNRIRWVAVGPFGLLPSSFDSSGLARAASLAAYDKMWAAQADRNEEELDALRLAETLPDVIVPRLRDTCLAVWIDGSPDGFLVLFDHLYGLVRVDSYPNKDELSEALESKGIVTI